MQDIAEHTDGSLEMGPGTLYGTIQRLMDAGMVREVESPPPESARDERRRHYRLTPAGRRALDAEVHRLEELVRVARGLRAPSKVKR
jgi:DNA-binding PadR family transcriptional regulator